MTRPSNPPRRGRRAGFTLVEILVALVVVILLIGLLVPALMGGLRAGKRTAVKAEISAMALALANFKLKYGDYPPSRIYLDEQGRFPLNGASLDTGEMLFNTTGSDPVPVSALVRRSLSILRKMFPQLVLSTDSTTPAIPDATGDTTTGAWFDFNGNGVKDLKPYILQGHECLVFFLGGIPTVTDSGYAMTGFDNYPKNPFLSTTFKDDGKGVNLNYAFSTHDRILPFYEFTPGRLVLDPRNAIGGNSNPSNFPGYYDSLGNTPPVLGDSQVLTLNFFTYFSPTGLAGEYDPNDVNFPYSQQDSDSTLLFRTKAVGAVNSMGPNPYTSSKTNLPTVTYINPQSYQIISSGFDGLYGIGGQYTPAPAPVALPPDSSATKASTGTVRDRERDNITNFAVSNQLD